MTDPGARRDDDGLVRCPWGVEPPEYRRYHDEEWGRPVVDDTRLFEKLCLEGFQSGLSWLTILRKRDAFRRAFAGFDVAAVAGFGPGDVERLLADAGIVRHRGKIEATIANARATRQVQEAEGSLAALVWRYEPPPGPAPRSMAELPATTPESVALSGELRRKGFPLRRSHHRLRRHAVTGPGRRPSRGLPRPLGVSGRAGRPPPPPTPLSPHPSDPEKSRNGLVHGFT